MTDSQDRDPVDRGCQARMRMISQDTYFRYYWPRLVRYLKSRASDTGLAEDVAADAIMAVLDKWDPAHSPATRLLALQGRHAEAAPTGNTGTQSLLP